MYGDLGSQPLRSLISILGSKEDPRLGVVAVSTLPERDRAFLRQRVPKEY